MATIPIAFCADENYATYVPTLIRSVLEHASQESHYSFYFFYHNTSSETLEVIRGELAGYSYASITTIDVNDCLEEYKEIFSTSGYISSATYARFFLSDMLSTHDLIIYLDIDVLVKFDVAELYHQPLGNHIVGAVADVWCEGKIQKNPCDFGKYVSDILKLPSENYYFNAGILLLNAQKWRGENYTRKCLEKLKEIGAPRFFDQCTLNAVCSNDVYYLPVEWNCVNTVDFYPSTVKKYTNLLASTKEAQKHSKIVHFIGTLKPWHINVNDAVLGEPMDINYGFRNIKQWWRMAKQTKSYPWLLSRNKKNETPAMVKKKYLCIRVVRTWLTRSVYFLGIEIYKRVKSDEGRIYYVLGIPIKKFIH